MNALERSIGMASDATISPPVPAALPRWVGLGVLLAAEALALTLRYDTETLRGQPGLWSAALAQAHHLSHAAVAVVLAVVLLGGGRLLREFRRLALRRTRSALWPLLTAHAGAFAVFFRMTAVVFEAPLSPAMRGVAAVAWLFSGALTVALALLVLLPAADWLRLLRRSGTVLAIGTVAGLAAWMAGLLVGCVSPELQRSTFTLVRGLLHWSVADVIVDTGRFVIGTPTFTVHVAPECSGYEGLGLVCVFLAVYLALFRRHFRFPQAVLLIPLGGLAVYLLNAVRIAGLVLIGTHLSRDVALGGFHTQAGWIAVNGVALGLALLSLRLRFFSADAAPATGTNPTGAYLAPLLTLLAVSMLTGAFSAGFDKLYPVRVVAVLLVLNYFRGQLTDLRWGWSWMAVGVGTAVYGMWLLLEPLYRGGPDATVADGLASLPPGWAVVWLVFRAVGSVVTVPLTEELAFRGYLTRRLQAANFTEVPPGRLTLFALIASSLLFGALHGRWLAGTLAGAAYAGVYHRRGRLSDAVLAHATTNALLTVHVLATGDWPLWS